ncbi:MAG TPA: pyridoxal 5'-phosphate synthase [Pseudonocardiaceae bacterium]|nr:pyridoxal 5'-phosphate synthase [Pseudonocardiaceae bacterium]
MTKTIRERLRDLPSLAGPLPAFDPDAAPNDPVTLFQEWLGHAIESGIIEPHAMTLSTVDWSGRPSARVLILKNVEGRAWEFASGASGRKGKELADNPWAALTFYWPALGRQVRVRGAVTPKDGAGDYLGRSAAARAIGLLGRQSEPLTDPRELAEALDAAAERIAADPDLVAPDWTVYAVEADEVEFWQGDQRRRHHRLCYRWSGAEWTREQLWP